MPSVTRGPMLAALALALVACGGGGGNDPPPPPPMTISPTSVTMTAAEGSTAGISTTITLDAQVDTSNAVYLEIKYDHTVFTDPALNASAERQAVATFPTSSSLPPNEYVGEISFRVCKDSSCTQRYSDVATDLSYHITIMPAPPAATITPMSLDITVEAGDPVEARVVVDVRSDSYASSFGIEDPLGIFSLTPDATYLGSQQYTLTLKGPPISTPDTYTGTANVLLCNSSPCSGSTKIPGSPIPLPYVVTVTPPVTLNPIPTATGLPEWETFQGNPEHSGYVPVTLDATTFQSLWTWTSPFDSATNLSPVTTGSGKAVVVASGYFSPASLLALNEADGTTAWRYDFGSIFTVNHPATSVGRIFVASSGHEDTAMWSFDLETGQEIFRTPFYSQWEHYLAPTFKGRTVYTDGGTYGGMYAFNASSGALRWFVTLPQYELWSPAVDDKYAYAHTGYEWIAIDRTTGIEAFRVDNSTFNWRGYALNIAPVIDTVDSQLVVDGIYNFDTQSDNHLIRYRVSDASELWRVDGRFASNPAAAKGSVYLLNAAGNQLEARAGSNGALLWSWSPADTNEVVPVGNVLVTDNLVFFCTKTTTYAIDIDSHEAVWSAPHSGALALSSNGVLYIVAPAQIDTYKLL